MGNPRKQNDSSEELVCEYARTAADGSHYTVRLIHSEESQSAKGRCISKTVATCDINHDKTDNTYNVTVEIRENFHCRRWATPFYHGHHIFEVDAPFRRDEGEIGETSMVPNGVAVTLTHPISARATPEYATVEHWGGPDHKNLYSGFLWPVQEKWSFHVV